MKEVTINDISFDVLHKLIEFLYTDQSSLDGESVLELFIAADKFDQSRLKYVTSIDIYIRINYIIF